MKRAAGEKAVQEIESGMTVGLGTGSTVYFTIKKIAEQIERKNLNNIVAIPSSDRTEKLARKLNIPLITFSDKDFSRHFCYYYFFLTVLYPTGAGCPYRTPW